MSGDALTWSDEDLAEIRSRTALIMASPAEGPEELLAAFVARRRAEGVRLGGVLQHSRRAAPEEGRAEDDGRPVLMELEDLATGERFRIDQPLGNCATGCVLDVQQLARGAGILDQAIRSRVDLLIVNKFSRQEAKGEGLLAEMFAAISEGIPMLSTLNPERLMDWEELSGGCAMLLAPDEDMLEAWWQQVG